MISVSPTRAAKILGLTLDILDRAILRQAYVLAIREAHPDAGGASRKYTLAQIKEARDVLSAYMDARE